MRLVHFDAEARGLQLGLDLLRVFVMPLADGHQTHLHRREPQRESSGVVLDQHAEEALDRTEERAMNHHRLMALAVFADILKLEARGQS